MKLTDKKEQKRPSLHQTSCIQELPNESSVLPSPTKRNSWKRETDSTTNLTTHQSEHLLPAITISHVAKARLYVDLELASENEEAGIQMCYLRFVAGKNILVMDPLKDSVNL